MIFGFNTDISLDGTVYHVQTELRGQERRMESQVFVGGRCIGKRQVPLPAETTQEGIQELARSQHRWVVDAVRSGFVDDVLNPEVAEELAIHFLGSTRLSERQVRLRFRVLAGGNAAEGAEIAASWKSDAGDGQLPDCVTDSSGMVEMWLELTQGSAELELRARLEERQARRRFLVKSAKS